MLSADTRVALSSIGENRLNRLNGTANHKRRSFYDSIPLHPNKKHKASKANNSNKLCDNNIDVYANKLRFKLRLAIYKLNQQNSRRAINLSFNSPTASSTKLVPQAQFNLKTAESPLTRKIRLVPSQSFKRSFSNSINVNLNEHEPLSALAKHKTTSQNSLKLFTIKRESPFFHENNTVIPLKPSQHIMTSASSFRNSAMVLPSINKILKTPLKLTNSTRNLIDHSDSTIISNDLTTDDTIEESVGLSKKPILTSSPIKNNFATPNSFSVAKSLLQLGSGYYN